MAKKNAETATQGVLDETGEGFTWDMSSTEASDGFPVLPKGNYDAIVDDMEYQISKTSGNPMWKVTFLITEADVADNNHKVFNYQVFKADQMGRVKAFLENLGRADLATADFNPKKIAEDKVLVGAAARLRLDIRKSEEYGDQNEIKRIMAPGTGSGGSGDGGFSM